MYIIASKSVFSARQCLEVSVKMIIIQIFIGNILQC